MGRQPNFGTPIAFGLILAALVMGYFDYSGESGENAAKRHIGVMGKADEEVEADRAVWKGRMVNEASSLQRGHASVEADKELLKEFLAERGIDSTRIEYDPLQVRGHSSSGRTGRYTLEQSFMVRGSDPEAVRSAAREAPSLMERGVRIHSERPRYRYSELSSLRRKLNAAAAMDALEKARIVADSSNVELDGLQKLREKAFHIEGTDPEEGSAPDYEYTRSIEQSVRVQVKAQYRID